jgi:hypothetical protein
VLLLHMAALACEAAGEVARLGDYQATEEQLQRVASAIVSRVRAALEQILESDVEVPDAVLLEAARQTGAGVVVELLGPPAPGALN